jgi:signal transduction histidine kinase
VATNDITSAVVCADGVTRTLRGGIAPVPDATGLGLSVVYGIVTRNRGRVHVRSRVGRGVVFTIELPAGVRNAAAA